MITADELDELQKMKRELRELHGIDIGLSTLQAMARSTISPIELRGITTRSTALPKPGLLTIFAAALLRPVWYVFRAVKFVRRLHAKAKLSPNRRVRE